MKKFALLFMLTGAAGLSAAESRKWVGTLVAADCSDMRYASAGEPQGLSASTPQAAPPGATTETRDADRQKAVAALPPPPPGCEVKETTAEYALIIPEGKMVKLDKAGSARVKKQLRGRFGSQQAVKVEVSGHMQAERIVVKSAKML